MSKLIAFGLLITYLAVSYASIEDTVPVLFWSNIKDQSNVMVPSLKILEKDEFQNVVKDQKAHQIIIFTADELKPSDFTLKTSDGVSCYEDVAKITNKRYIPAVKNAVKSLIDMSESHTDVYVQTDNELSGDITTDTAFIALPKCLDQNTLESCHSQYNRIIAKLMKSFDGKEVLFIFTARKNPQQQSHHSRVVRDVSESAKSSVEVSARAKESILKLSNALIYVAEVNEYLKKEQKSNVIDITGSTQSLVTDNDVTVELKSDKYEFTLHFNKTGDTWNIDSIIVNNKAVKFNQVIGASIGSSYKCSSTVHISYSDNQVDSLSIRGLQIEPKFGNSDQPITRFGPAVDCVGFTTAAIWAGLFVVFLLLSILTVGISFMMDIRTMDRFDDPKGKTITVSATD